MPLELNRILKLLYSQPMKNRILAAALIIVAAFSSPSYSAKRFESIELLNSSNLAVMFEKYIGYLYDSHGCLHFTPSDIYLLTETVPKKIPVDIRDYSGAKPEYDLAKVPFFNMSVSSHDDILKYRKLFRENETRIIAYPSWNRLLITVSGNPVVQTRMLAGPQNNLRRPMYIEKGGPIIWDPMRAGPTDTGAYSILAPVKDYISANYRNNTLIPFGGEIKREGSHWYYTRSGKRHRIPPNVAQDLALPETQRSYNYFNIVRDGRGKISSLRWGSHDFGRYVLLWTKDGKRFYPEMGYAEGELYFEQSLLIEDLAHILSMPGPDDFDTLVSKNEHFGFYREIHEYLSSKGKTMSPRIDPTNAAYYKLYNGLALTPVERAHLDPRIVEAYRSVRNKDLPSIWIAREQTLGLYNYLKMNSLVFEKYANFYGLINKDWEFWSNARRAFREDFRRVNILSSGNQKDIIENLINKRLEFYVLGEKDIDYMGSASIASFFEEEESSFAKREKDAAVTMLRDSGPSGSDNLTLLSTDALNKYNFGVLLDEMLGNLYKSHGCMHVSPRDAYIMYSLLPVNSKITVKPYSDSYDAIALSKIPHLAGLTDTEGDLLEIKKSIKSPRDIEVEVYPATGDWIIFMNKAPFAKLRVLGGGKDRLRRVEYRSSDGKPIFSDNIAYPTSSGTFYVFKKVESYVSKIYRDTTIIPMGSLIRKMNGKWTFEDEKGSARPLPAPIAEDLRKPEDKMEFKYYDVKRDKEGKLTEAKWSSHEFGKYAIMTTADRRTMWPELIHTSGELMYEQRQLVSDLIKILATPKDSFDECVKANPSFDLYRECYNFVNDPKGKHLITPAETGRYKLYMGLALTPTEEALIPKDAFIADKILKNKGELSETERKHLIDTGIARMSGGKTDIDMLKIQGINFETFQNVVVIQKYAHHYDVLRTRWDDLSQLRRAMFSDFSKLLVRDPDTLRGFIEKLMMKRLDMKKISQEDVAELLSAMLGEKGR
jgi:hypothetical protein